MQVGDLVRYLAGIPDYGVGIVIEKYVSPHASAGASVPKPYSEVKVHWSKPKGHVAWTSTHHLVQLATMENKK